MGKGSQGEHVEGSPGLWLRQDAVVLSSSGWIELKACLSSKVCPCFCHTKVVESGPRGCKVNAMGGEKLPPTLWDAALLLLRPFM